MNIPGIFIFLRIRILKHFVWFIERDGIVNNPPLGITANNQQKLKWYTCTVLHSNTVISTTCTHVQQYYVLHVVHMYLNLLWIVSIGIWNSDM